jgi:hypothetical protein
MEGFIFFVGFAGVIIAVCALFMIHRDGDRNIDILNRKLRDSYMDSTIRKYIKDNFLK